MLKTIFPTIISLPRIYDAELHHAIEYANQLDVDLDNEEFQVLLEKYPESPEIRCAYFESLLENIVEEENTQIYEQINKMVAEHPDNLSCKITGYHSEMDKNPDIDTQELFAHIFEKEIAALLYDEPYTEVVSDANLLWIMKLMMINCFETENKDGIEKLFLTLRSMQWYDELTELSSIATGNYFTLQDLDDEDCNTVDKWYNRIFETTNRADLNIKPYYEIFYKILNRPIKDFADEDIAAVLNIQNKEKIAHDIQWLLDQGCHRILQLNGKCNCDFVLQATYLIAHFQLKELAPLITRTLTGTPEIIFENITGDFSGEVLLPWVYSLGKMDLTGWWELMTYSDVDGYDESIESIESLWYSKIIWLNALVKISNEAGPQSERAKQLMDKVWLDYQKSEHECLGWLMYYILSYKIDTYDARIKEAYENDLIDQYVHGTFKDAMEDKRGNINFFVESHTPEGIGDNYQEIIKYVRKLETEYQASSSDTVTEEMEYFAKKADNRSDFEELLDIYDERDSAGKLSAMELAILETLDQGDNSYVPHTKESIVPIKRDGPKIGRNDPCPCGSDKKYKKCCL